MSRIRIIATRLTKGSKYAMFEESEIWKDGMLVKCNKRDIGNQHPPFFVNFLLSSEYVGEAKKLTITIDEDVD